MSTLSYTLRDSTTMLRRNVRHSLRYPAMTISGLIVPIFFLLLFVGVFGCTLRAGLTGASVAGGHYIDYLAPGILLMTAGAGAAATAVGICTDMSEGIIARFRTMAITRASVLTGQVLGYEPEGSLDFGLDRAALTSGAPAREVILLHATARPEKQWPAANWIELSQALAARGYVRFFGFKA